MRSLLLGPLTGISRASDLGLLTRPAAAFVAGNMLVVAMVAHAGDSFGHREKPVLFLAIAVLYLFTGPGRYSFDALLFGRRGA